MMGFDTLSQVAHRLEDFLKILRVRYASRLITTEVETLLLQSVDRLRHIASLNRQGLALMESYASVRPIFEQLRQYLGDLEDTDEDALMEQEEGIDPALLVFEEGVDSVLERFESQFKELKNAELVQELTTTAQELLAFGTMANLEAFIQLCESIQKQAQIVSLPKVQSLADKALKAWKRSHALILRGNIEKLPFCLESNCENLALDFKEVEPEIDLNPLEIDSLELSDLESVFEAAEPEIDLNPLEVDSLELSDLALDFDSCKKTSTTIHLETPDLNPSQSPQKTSSVEKMVKVPASQLKQFNSLFEQLILDRNTINLRLQQFQNVIALMNQRISQIESSNNQLKQWYDNTPVEGLPATHPEKFRQNLVSSINNHASSDKSLLNGFDSLEMDTYSGIHPICQEQMETIVQLKEVATDIKLGLQDINQAVRNLNYTTKSMQGNVTRTQMLPFSEVVKRFPRVIRDLCLQFNKQVNLKIFGENTLLDRSAIEALGDPLIHLLRNAFDHGIEDSETRIAAGKPPSGTITIGAKNQGTYTLITLRDDGNGICLDKIRDRLVTMGIARSEVTQIPETELLSFIFDPGFSTAKQVTELSGRGVGMDVVKTNLQEICGDVKVTNRPGRGTTFTLKIPFTLSILRVAVIEQAGIILAIPANSIRELVPLSSELIQTSEDIKSILWNQTKIPLIEIEKTLVYRRSHNTFNLTSNPAIDRSMALVIGDETSCTALQISRFWHEQESTIKTIDSLIPLPPCIISSVVFGDGKVIPLVDPMLLIETCLKNPSFKDNDHQNLTKTENISTIKTILVVDDSINVRRYLSLTLEKVGYQVEQAKDGREAIEKLFAGVAVQAVICDIEMPQLDGYGVLEEIKERAEFEYLPIVMLTSRSNEKHRKLAMNLGASAYFSKPYKEQELLDKLTELLQYEN